MDEKLDPTPHVVIRRVGLEGKVKWFDPQKGYGFILGPEGEDVFVHYSEIVADGFRVLREGVTVRYEAERGAKGWSARSVVRVDNGTKGNGSNGTAAAIGASVQQSH